jgi:hypothetical protein
MIRIECPNCHCKLNAKEELIGQVRACPKCKSPITIEAPATEIVASSPIDFQAIPNPPAHAMAPDQRNAVSEGLGFQKPHRLDPHYKYLVLGPNGLIAKWEGSTDGWQLKTTSGFLGAKRNPEGLPKEGRFVLVELRVRTVEAVGHRLSGLCVFRLTQHWALSVLAKGESDILKKIEGYGGLLRDQKLAVRRYLRETYMPEFMHRAHKTLEFLSGDDFRSHMVMENGEG